MAAYLIGTVDVHDQTEYQKYLEGFGASIAPFKARVLVATTDAEVVEGTWPKARTIVIEFPSKDVLREWYDSASYQKILQHRMRAATSHLVIAEGRA